MSNTKGYTSAGIHSSVSKSTRKMVRANRTEGEILQAKQDAWLKGSNPWVTMKNPNKEETNRPYVKMRMNDLMHGTAKDREKNKFVMK